MNFKGKMKPVPLEHPPRGFIKKKFIKKIGNN